MSAYDGIAVSEDDRDVHVTCRGKSTGLFLLYLLILPNAAIAAVERSIWPAVKTQERQA